MVLFIMLFKVVLPFDVVYKILKAAEQYYTVVLLLMVVLTFELVLDEILKYNDLQLE